MLISFDLKADFGFLKKPDINDSIYLTYNMLHKPALLGILGAILGLSGHQKYGELPEYYQKLSNLKVGIEPIGMGQKNGNFEKIVVKYNNSTGQANVGTLNILEQILISPAYRIYLDFNRYGSSLYKTLYEKLRDGKGTFIPYLGKNDFPCWWENFREYDAETALNSETFKIRTIFLKFDGKLINDFREPVAFGLMAGIREKAELIFSQFERLPIMFNETLRQYDTPKEFVYTNIKFSKEKFVNDSNFKEIGEDSVIYLF